jgi:hypothetical protein
VPTYTVEELTTIAKRCNQFEKAVLGVCVNCAFGASEVGQWKMDDYLFRTKHRYEKEIGMETTSQDCWIVGFRPKKPVYGEHLIWEEVAKAVEPFFDSREVLPISKIGKPWYRPQSKNAQAKFANWWSDKIKAIQIDEPDFRYLPFGSLRDLLPNLLEREYNKEVADMCLHHGDVEHDILKCYSNVPFRKLFRATEELKPMFQPFLVELKNAISSS